jgi:AICAR transformylase/IMP cyclohydrolase PurH
LLKHSSYGERTLLQQYKRCERAIEILKDFNGEPTVVAGNTQIHADCKRRKLCDAYVRAYEADPVSIYGGILPQTNRSMPKPQKKWLKLFWKL